MEGRDALHSTQHTHCIKPWRFKAPRVTLVTTACVTMKLIHPMAACCLPAALSQCACSTTADNVPVVTPDLHRQPQ